MFFKISMLLVAVIAIVLLVRWVRQRKHAAQLRIKEAEQLQLNDQAAGLVTRLVDALAQRDQTAFERITTKRHHGFLVRDPSLPDGEKLYIPVSTGFGEALQDAYNDYLAWIDCEKLRPELAQLRNPWAARASAQDRVLAGRKLFRVCFEDGDRATITSHGWRVLTLFRISLDELRELFNQAMRARHDELLQAFRRGSTREYEALRYCRNELKWDVKKWGVVPIALPSDWNQLVSEKFDTPHLSDFTGLRNYGDMPTGTVALMAATAVREDDQLGGKVVLAYVNCSDGNARREVPDGLLTQVVKMVERHNAVAHTASQLS